MIGNTTGAKTAFQDKGTYYELSAAAAPSPTAVTLRATKHPALTFSMYAGSTLLWKEAAPISWNTTTTLQSLEAGATPADAHFFGGARRPPPPFPLPLMVADDGWWLWGRGDAERSVLAQGPEAGGVEELRLGPRQGRRRTRRRIRPLLPQQRRIRQCALPSLALPTLSAEP